jgi:hypothetical protein
MDDDAFPHTCTACSLRKSCPPRPIKPVSRSFDLTEQFTMSAIRCLVLLAIAIPAFALVHDGNVDPAASTAESQAKQSGGEIPQVNLIAGAQKPVSAGPGLAIERVITFERFTQFRDKEIKHGLVPRISADGKKVAFASAEGTYALDVDTKAIRRLDMKPSAHIGLSADGRRIAWMDGGLASELHMANDDGSHHTKVKLDPDRGNVLRLTVKGDLAIVMTWHGTIQSYAAREDKLEKIKDILPKAEAVTALAAGKPVGGYGISAEMDASDNGEHIIFRAGQFIMKIKGDGSGLAILKDFGDGFTIDKLAMSGSGERVACFGRPKGGKTALTFWTWDGAKLPIEYTDLVHLPNSMQMTRDGKHVLYSGYYGRVMKFAVDQLEKLDATEQGVPMSEFAGRLSITADARLGTMQTDDVGDQIVLIDFNPAALLGAPRILDVRASARTLPLRGGFTYVSARSDPKIRELKALLLRDNFFSVGSVLLSAPQQKGEKEPPDRTYSGNLELRADPKLSPGPLTLRLIAQSEAKHTLVLDLKGITTANLVKIDDQQIAKRLSLSVEQVQQLRARGFTSERLMSFPLNQLSLLRQKLANTKLQEDRAAFTARLLKNEKGVIPADGKLKAILQIRAEGKAVKPGYVAGLPVGPTVDPRNLLPNTAGLSPKRWEALGPRHVGGRTRALVIHPQQPNIMYAGSVGGGIWKSITSGGSWEVLDAFTANLAVTCLVMHPTNPNILYAGTGEGFQIESFLIPGGGIFKTSNGGTSWEPVPGPTPTPAAFTYVNRLAISPDGKVLLAAVGPQRSPSNTGKYTNGAGVYRLVLDAPQPTWDYVLGGNLGCVLVHPSDSTQCLASSMQGGPGSPIAWYSTKGGASGTWSPSIALEGSFQTVGTPGIGQEQPRVELAYARNNPEIVYASADQPGGAKVYRSTNGGQTFQRKGSTTYPLLMQSEPVSFLAAQGSYDNTIWAGDPTRPDLVIVGGVELWKSDDGGDTLRQLSKWGDKGTAHADQHTIVSHPQYDGQNNKTVFIGNDGGIYHVGDITTVAYSGASPDSVYNGQGWNHKVTNYAVTEFWGVAGFTDATRFFLVAGAQDNGNHKCTLNTMPSTWSNVWMGDGAYCAIDQEMPNWFYGEYINLAVFRVGGPRFREDYELEAYISGFYWNGQKWVRRPGEYSILDARNPGDKDDPGLGSNFYAPFLLDPNDQKRLLAGGVSLWVTDNARQAYTDQPMSGPTWKKIKNAGNQFLSAIAVAKDESRGKVIWVGDNAGGVYKTSDGLKRDGVPAWNPVVIPGAPTNRVVTRIVINPRNPSNIYVTFGGYGAGSIWSTDNGGMNWTNRSGNLLAGTPVPVFTVAIHPRKANYLYVGTDVGVFASADGGAHWSATIEGPCHCAVSELCWMGEALVAATRGRGLYRIDLSQA